MDTFRLNRRQMKDGDYGYEVLDIVVNQRRLVDLLREIEFPFAEDEGHPDIAGSYQGLSPETVLYPSRHLLDEPDPSLQGPEGERTIVLVCGNCGEAGCWSFEVRIQLDEETVTWSDYCQPHRSDKWTYDALPKLVFDRRQYEAELGWPPDRR